jgi:predicted TIM-barrel fold metal-dependent hydrolase
VLRGKVIDADGHLLEPADLWQKYIEPKYRDRAIRMDKDPDGMEILIIDGRRSEVSRGIGPTGAGTGQPFEEIFKPGKFSYFDGPRGTYDAHARLKTMDEEGIDVAVVFPTLELLWEAEVHDAQLASAYCRAYNNWVKDWCSADPKRLTPVAHIPLLDIDEGIKEVKRIAKLGFAGVFVYAAPPNKISYWDRRYDLFWAVLQEHDLSIGFHVALNDNYLGHQWMTKEQTSLTDEHFLYMMSVPFVADEQAAFASLFQGAVFDRFPQLKIVLLETGGGWIAHLLERMDSKYRRIGYKTGLKMLPTEYFKRQCWISFDPDETTIPDMVKRYGADRFMWATDFPHWDASPAALEESKAAVASLPKEDQQKILGDNAAQVFNIS